MTGQVRIGLHSGQQYSTFAEPLDLWQRAEELGYDWVSLFDHYRPPLGGPNGPCFDGPTLLAALAAKTSRVRCGMLVAAVPWRHPAITAAIAATLDHASNGRLEFGIGAGGPDLGYHQFGIRFPKEARFDMLDETCEILRSLWTRESTTFQGKHYHLTEAHLTPKPLQTHLPLVIGGSGERRLLATVARQADVWNSLATEPKIYQQKLAALATHCTTAGRDPAHIRKSITFRAVLAETTTEAAHRKTERLQQLPTNSPDLAEYLTFGTPADCVRDLRPYLDLGVRDFLLGARPPLDWRTIELFATQVAPALRAATDEP